ncbi:hypothetical protein H9Y04_16225 [Streptomyces sp. TRM66268-LWL]|uniref:Uncharacterized protein n=1 Tax=Streptomyces polyasparticus TaxID=2767826 RepID=A0ABR7SFW6_9ACTN|nr:hypothetical protein [Streptomyces polyasparticus]MBC9714109.1 hypothetical protein [Streptomyces polyasparticus]
MSHSEPPRPRLLPWVGPEGKPCYLIGDGTGPVSRIADAVESTQLAMADDLVAHARVMLPSATTEPELRYLAAHLTEALATTLRIAHARPRDARPQGPASQT